MLKFKFKILQLKLIILKFFKQDKKSETDFIIIKLVFSCLKDHCPLDYFPVEDFTEVVAYSLDQIGAF